MSVGAISGFSRLSIGRASGVLFGAATQLLFLWTAVHLFWFLRGPITSRGEFSPLGDLCLALGFAWPHSLLLLPKVQSIIKRYLPAALLGCLHCTVTCLSLLLLFAFWTASPVMIWELHGASETLILVGFYGSWGALLYSVWLSGIGYQTGLLPWLYWVVGYQSPPRKFIQAGAFRWMRHPVYLSFLGLIWFTPQMSLDHLILTMVWTAYVYAGSYLKDRRLLRFIGQPYQQYAQRVPGFPLIGFGPWGRWALNGRGAGAKRMDAHTAPAPEQATCDRLG